MIQEKNGKNMSLQKKSKIRNICSNNINISQNHQKLTTESKNLKMEIEVADSNQLYDSLSTQDSNNIKSFLDSKNLNICNTNLIFFPQSNKNLNEIQVQSQIIIPNQIKNKTQIQLPSIINNKKKRKRKRNF